MSLSRQLNANAQIFQPNTGNHGNQNHIYNNFNNSGPYIQAYPINNTRHQILPTNYNNGSKQQPTISNSGRFNAPVGENKRTKIISKERSKTISHNEFTIKHVLSNWKIPENVMDMRLTFFFFFSKLFSKIH